MNVEELIVKQSIVEALHRYCRSIDDLDLKLYGTVFVTGAHLDYNDDFHGTAEQFRDRVWAARSVQKGHTHQITNVLSEVDTVTRRGKSVAYVMVCLRKKAAGGTGSVSDIVDTGRYLDQWTQGSDGAWRIAARRYVSDVERRHEAIGVCDAD